MLPALLILKEQKDRFMADIKIGRIALGSNRTNCYFLYRAGEADCVIIDPGDAGDYVYNGLKDKGFIVKAIMLTHGHFDHILGVKKLKQLAECDLYAYEEEKDLLANSRMNISEQFGRPQELIADYWLRDSETVNLCDITIKCIHTPGHTQGSCAFYVEEAGILVSGDTLFQGSIGRTDFPTGSERKLFDSVKEKLFVLPDDTKVYPGHGEDTTIGFEKRTNPFFAE